MENGTKITIRVVVVEDSFFMCKVIMNILNADPEIYVVGTARNGQEAVALVMDLKPDIVTMDVHMPVMDGLEATKQIMAYHPTPILIISASVTKDGMEKIFKAIYYGALDILDKSRLELLGDKKFGEELIEKIKLLSRIKVVVHPLARLEKTKKVLRVHAQRATEALDKIVAIAVSTGGPYALLEVLKRLPKDFPCGLVISQHIISGFLEGLVEWLDAECQIRVKVAEDGEKIQRGVAYLAPCDLQMRIEPGGRIRISDDPPRGGHKPSGDVLLESVALAYGQNAVGVILTGMGSDGAEGLRLIKEKAGQTIAQDEKTSVIFGMPKAAIDLGIVDAVLPVGEIAERIAKVLSAI